jgi:hypothetical protein
VSTLRVVKHHSTKREPERDCIKCANAESLVDAGQMVFATRFAATLM